MGRLSVEKGFFDLLEACRLLQEKGLDFEINILGKSPSLQYEKRIKDFVSLHQLEPYLIFHGLKYGEEKNYWFKKSKILVFPSHFENSPVVLKEAIAAKMAIIASDIEANKMILMDKNNTKFYPVSSSNHLANAIEELIIDKRKVVEMCLASSKVDAYNKNIAKQKLQELMHELCGDK